MNYSRVVRALVTDAMVRGTVGNRFTVPDIVAYYGLEWGAFANGANRAEQLVRNELNRACELHDGKHAITRTSEKDGAWRIYERFLTW